MDQSNRYANLNLKQADLIAGGRSVQAFWHYDGSGGRRGA